MASDISITINPPNRTNVTIGGGFVAHNFTHAPSGSDPLDQYYASYSDLAYLSGQITAPEGVVLLTGAQNISGAKNFATRYFKWRGWWRRKL